MSAQGEEVADQPIGDSPEQWLLILKQNNYWMSALLAAIEKRPLLVTGWLQQC